MTITETLETATLNLLTDQFYEVEEVATLREALDIEPEHVEQLEEAA